MKTIKKLVCIGTVVSTLVGCSNYRVVDMTYNYKYAIIELPNGKVVEGKIDSWRDYDNCTEISIKINGVDYLTSLDRCVLLTEEY